MNVRNVTQRSILAAVERGDWVFDFLAPRFQSLLSERIAKKFSICIREASSFSMLKSTALAYGELNDCERLSFAVGSRCISFDELSDRDRSALAHITGRVYADRAPGAFSSGDREALAAAIACLNERAPASARILEKFVQNVVKVDDVPFRSASYPRAQGCIFLGEKAFRMSPEALATSLVHELAHQELFLVNLIDRLVCAERDYNLVHAPFQGKCRPPIGRLHSFYALFRMIQFGRQIGGANKYHEDLLAATIDSFQVGELTPFCQLLVERCAGHVLLNQNWMRNA